NKDSAKSYLLNAYRVLLTRARQGMVIFIPAVDGKDPTRPQKYYDSIYNYLVSCGLDIM
ncbi:MAG: DNA/RNA helicase domain-containing protein, partial [Pseudomonadota bacterium]|nr:DNA/RNA helicase domain-containing protein [Pseudomonadota bacterium]